MPWTFSAVEDFEDLTADCLLTLVQRWQEVDSEDSIQEIRFGVLRWREFLKEVKDFENRCQDPSTLPLVREYGSGRPQYHIFRSKPFNVIYRCEFKAPGSGTARATYIFHDRDAKTFIGRTFA